MRPLDVTLVVVAGAACFASGSAGQPSAAAYPERRAELPAPVWQATTPGEQLLPTVLSLALPGAGQHVLGQRRKWAYLALEVAGWAAIVERRRAGSHYRDVYRDFAWERARLQGTTRVDGDFDYYEVLTHWTRSGAFDSDPGQAGVQPELDAGSYNGSVWSLAARIFLGGDPNAPETTPGYQSALAYYGDEAYGVDLLWDWSSMLGAQQEFADLVGTSDSRFRQATTVLGVVIANHLLSAGDAYISSSRVGAAAARIRLVPGAMAGADWAAVLTLPAPR